MAAAPEAPPQPPWGPEEETNRLNINGPLPYQHRRTTFWPLS